MAALGTAAALSKPDQNACGGTVGESIGCGIGEGVEDSMVFATAIGFALAGATILTVALVTGDPVLPPTTLPPPAPRGAITNDPVPLTKRVRLAFD